MVDTTWMGDWTCGSSVPTRKKTFMEMVYYRELNPSQKEAALLCECSVVLQALKSEDYAVLRKYDARLVSDFKYLAFIIKKGNSADKAVIYDLKRKLSKGIIGTVVKYIFANVYPKNLDPARVFTLLVTYPSQPYRSFLP